MQWNISTVIWRDRLNGIENIKDVQLPCRHLVNCCEVRGCSEIRCTMHHWCSCRRHPRLTLASGSGPHRNKVGMMTNACCRVSAVGWINFEAVVRATNRARQRRRSLKGAVMAGSSGWRDSKPGRGRRTDDGCRHRRGVEALPRLSRLSAVLVDGLFLPVLATNAPKSSRMNSAVIRQRVAGPNAPISQPLSHLLDADPASRC